LDDVYAPGYRGRKRGQVVRTRTVISQAHSYHWLGSFGNRGNGRYQEELRKGLAAICRYLTASQLDPSRTLLRLDGQYGTGAVLVDLAGFAFVTRGKEYSVLDHPQVQARLHLPSDQVQQRTAKSDETPPLRLPQVPVGPEGVLCRVIVATHPAGKKKSPVGVTRAGLVYEVFLTNLPQQVFTACDVVELYLHRGAFEPTLSDEDREQDPDRWCSQSAWQCVAQWVWNLRLELGHYLRSAPRSLLLLSRHHRYTRLLPPAMLLGRWVLHGKRAASQARIFVSSPMERCGVLLNRRCSRMSNAEKPMGACAWCMEPAFAVVVPVPCVSNASGMALLTQSRSRLVLRRFSGGIGAGESTDAPVSNSCETSGSR
jgi:hypothetical protein